jgi:hypothetical protein
MLQVGARNMQNFALLRRLAAVNNPILLKRGPSATVKEWLLAAEYLLSGGNQQVPCERGIKTFETEMRDTIDLAAVALARDLSHLPVMADPSHGTRQAEPDCGGFPGSSRGRRRWPHYRGAPVARTRALGWSAIARLRRIRKGDAISGRTFAADCQPSSSVQDLRGGRQTVASGASVEEPHRSAVPQTPAQPAGIGGDMKPAGPARTGSS